MLKPIAVKVKHGYMGMIITQDHFLRVSTRKIRASRQDAVKDAIKLKNKMITG